MKVDKSLIRFVFVGLGATAIHVLTVSILIPTFKVDAGLSHGLGFILATFFSNYVNTRWSFSAQFSQRTISRFWIVASIGCVAAIGIGKQAETAGLHYLVGVAIIVCVLPALTYLAHRFWTYAD